MTHLWLEWILHVFMATGRSKQAKSGQVDAHTWPNHLPFQMINGTSLYEFACVFWNYELNDWSTDGCSKGNSSDGFLRCFCNHTTNFAALWVMINFRAASHIIKGFLNQEKWHGDSLIIFLLQSFRENYEYAKALDWISIIGLCVSMMGLVVTIVHHLKYKWVLPTAWCTRQDNLGGKKWRLPKLWHPDVSSLFHRGTKYTTTVGKKSRVFLKLDVVIGARVLAA